MSRESIEVEIEPVTRKEWETARGQAQPQSVDEPMRHVLRAGTQLEDGKNLGAGINGQPEPEHLFGTAEAGAQFVQLEVREVEMEEEALVQSVRVYTCTSEPGGDSGLTIAEDPFGGGRIQPFSQGREHHGDLLRGGFQTIQGRVPPGSERGAASLTAKRLDALGLAVLAIANQRMNMSLDNAEVQALLVGTGVTLGVDSLGCSPAAFDLAPGAYWCWRWPYSRRGSGGETTGGAIVWGSWLQETLERGALGSSS